jgi:hypothetical protein
MLIRQCIKFRLIRGFGKERVLDMNWLVFPFSLGPALYYMNSADSSDGNSGWYDADGNPQDANSALWPQAGQSFFINHANVTSTWTNGFVVP